MTIKRENLKDLRLFDLRDENYIKEGNFYIKLYRDQLYIKNLENALKPGKNVITYGIESLTFGEDFSIDLANYISDEKLTIEKFAHLVLSENLPENFKEKFKMFTRSEKGVKVFSPYVEVKEIKAPEKWTLPHVWKAILSGQMIAGEKKMRLTDDYAYDAATDFGKGSLDLIEFAKEIIEHPSGWHVWKGEETEEKIKLSVNCHSFDYNTLVFSKKIKASRFLKSGDKAAKF